MNQEELGNGLGHALLAGAAHLVATGVCSVTPIVAYWSRHPTFDSVDDASRAWGLLVALLWVVASAIGTLLVSGAFVLGFGCPRRRSTVALAGLAGVASAVLLGLAWTSFLVRQRFTEVGVLGFASGIAATLLVQVWQGSRSA